VGLADVPDAVSTVAHGRYGQLLSSVADEAALTAEVEMREGSDVTRASYAGHDEVARPSLLSPPCAAWRGFREGMPADNVPVRPSSALCIPEQTTLALERTMRIGVDLWLKNYLRRFKQVQ
jgi:hypothetical protein